MHHANIQKPCTVQQAAKFISHCSQASMLDPDFALCVVTMPNGRKLNLGISKGRINLVDQQTKRLLCEWSRAQLAAEALSHASLQWS